MKRLFYRLAPSVALGVVLCGACAPNNSVPPGPPVLTSFQVIDSKTGAADDLTVDGAAVTVPPYAHLFALFDRLLDGAAVTMLDPDGGADLGRTDLATITVSGGPVPPLQEIYSPNGGPVGLFFSQGPSITVLAMPTFPSASTITVTLDKSKIHSKAGDPFTGTGALADGQLMFQTAPFSAAVNPPPPDPGADGGTDDAGTPLVLPSMMSMATIQFNNLTDPMISDHVTVTAAGAPFSAVTVAIDATDPTLVDVTPTVTWPANTTITVTVDANAADALGVKLGTLVSGSFTTDTGP